MTLPCASLRGTGTPIEDMRLSRKLFRFAIVAIAYSVQL